MIRVESLIEASVKEYIDGKWVYIRPVKDNRISERFKDAIQVLIGKAEAVKFHKP